MVDACASGAYAARRGGSSPLPGTKQTSRTRSVRRLLFCRHGEDLNRGGAKPAVSEASEEAAERGEERGRAAPQDLLRYFLCRASGALPAVARKTKNFLSLEKNGGEEPRKIERKFWFCLRRFKICLFFLYKLYNM